MPNDTDPTKLAADARDQAKIRLTKPPGMLFLYLADAIDALVAEKRDAHAAFETKVAKGLWVKRTEKEVDELTRLRDENARLRSMLKEIKTMCHGDPENVVAFINRNT